MSVTPDEILDSAKALGLGNTEIEWRNAVSRAYYAAYHRCRLIVESLDPNLDATKASGHAAVIDVLTELGSSNTQKAIGYKLSVCRVQRNVADYDIGCDFGADSCQSTLQMCDEIFEKADAIN